MKKKRIKHFTAKDAARCIAYARRDGASDKDIIKYVIEAYGLTNISCMVSQTLIMITNKIFVDSILLALGGFLVILKGLKIIVEGKISAFTFDIIGQFIRKYYPSFSVPYGIFLTWTGTTVVLIETLSSLLTSAADQVIYFKYLDDVCSMPIEANPYPINPPPPNFELIIKDSPQDKQEKSQWQRYIDLVNELLGLNTLP